MTILELRKACMMTQAEFGRLYGVHEMTVSKWERGLTEPGNWVSVLVAEMEKSPARNDLKITLNLHGPAKALAVMLAHLL